jgi:NAD(P)-dependent dehydrogenase (short-subunit alcohol dehydrogenase family)
MKKRVFITGCSSGLGRETAMQLAQAGYIVYAGVRRSEDISDLQRSFDVFPIQLDLTNRAQITEAATFLTDQCGNDGLSLLINMAGYTFVSPIEYTNQSEITDLFDVIVFGPNLLTSALLPALKKYSTSSGDNAKVLNIVSWAALDASPFVGFYAAAKAALLRLTEAQSLEFGRIKVDAIAILSCQPI